MKHNACSLTGYQKILRACPVHRAREGESMRARGVRAASARLASIFAQAFVCARFCACRCSVYTLAPSRNSAPFSVVAIGFQAPLGVFSQLPLCCARARRQFSAAPRALGRHPPPPPRAAAAAPTHSHELFRTLARSQARPPGVSLLVAWRARGMRARLFARDDRRGETAAQPAD